MPFEVIRVNHACISCKNETTFRTPKGYFCRNCLNVEPYQKDDKVIVMPDTMIEEAKQIEQVQEIQEAIDAEKPSQQSIENVSEESSDI